MNDSPNLTVSLQSSSEQTNAQCPGLVAQNAVLGTACFLGIIANSVLLVFSFKYRRGNLTPDKILIINFAAADLIACLVSLPLHVKAINGTSDLADNKGTIQKCFSFFLLEWKHSNFSQFGLNHKYIMQRFMFPSQKNWFNEVHNLHGLTFDS